MAPDSKALHYLVGVTAILAPVLHSATDVFELVNGGFTPGMLWLNYVAFLPMPWLLLGIYAVHDVRPPTLGLVGAVLYGAAFTYFAHTTLFALIQRTPTYEELWLALGTAYTVHGALMVIGGLMFAWAMLRAAWLPQGAIWLFALGLLFNLVLAVLPVPDILQTLGTALRNTGLLIVGYAILGHTRKTTT